MTRFGSGIGIPFFIRFLAHLSMFHDHDGCLWPFQAEFAGEKPLYFLFTFTMMFGGGLVPFYLLLRDLKMLNTVWAMLIPGAISVYNMIVARTFIQSNIPAELSEAASIDGCSDFRYFFEILLPLSKAILAVLALFYAVGHWNSYFNAMIYLRDPSLFPLQIVLREILILNQIDPSMMLDSVSAGAPGRHGRSAQIFFDRSGYGTDYVCLSVCAEILH